METQPLDLIPGNVKKAVGGASSGDLWMVKRDLIRTHPKLQPRDKTSQAYKDRVRHLADLIKANGYDRAFPLKVYAARENDEDVLYVVQGHRRLEAVNLAASEGKEINTVPCVTTDRGTSMEDLMFATVNGNESDPLQPIEKAQMVRELMGCNLELDYIAKRMGYTLPYVKNLLSILEAPATCVPWCRRARSPPLWPSRLSRSTASRPARCCRPGWKQPWPRARTR